MKKINLFGAYVAPQVRECSVRVDSGFSLSQPSDFNDLEFENRTEW